MFEFDESRMDLFDFFSDETEEISETNHEEVVDAFTLLDMANTALEVIEEKLETQEKPDLDLLSMGLKLTTDLSMNHKAEMFYQKLKEIPEKRWTATAYMRAIEYLLSQGRDEEQEIRDAIEALKKSFPYMESATLLEVQLEETLGNYDYAYTLLEKRIEMFPNAAKCACELAKRQMERGLYKDMMKTVQYGYAASSVSEDENFTDYVSQMMLLEVFAEEHFILERYYEEDLLSAASLKKMIHNYKNLLFDNELETKSGVIKGRIKLLEHLLQQCEDL